MIPLRIAIPAALALAGAAGGYWRGSQAEHARHIVREDAAAARINAARERLVGQLNTVSGELAAAQATQAAQFTEIHHETTRIIDRPVYRSVAVDADGVRLLDRARAAASRGLAGEPADPAGAVAFVPAQP